MITNDDKRRQFMHIYINCRLFKFTCNIRYYNINNTQIIVNIISK